MRTNGAWNNLFLLGVAVSATVLAALLAAWPPWRAASLHLSRAKTLWVPVGNRSYALGRSERLWHQALVQAIEPRMRDVLYAQLGDDPDSVLVSGPYRGLGRLHDPAFIVATENVTRLRQKLQQLDGGTIAVCGPRGVGKSTLLLSCVSRTSEAGATGNKDLRVSMHAPADYSLQDFLLTMSGVVCERFLEMCGPNETAPDPFDSVRPRPRRSRLRKYGIGTGFALVALAFAALAAWEPVARVTAFAASLDQDRLADGWHAFVKFRAADPATFRNVAIVLVIGTLISWLMWAIPDGSWEWQPKHSQQAKECRRYLNRLRTVQGTSTATTRGMTLPQGPVFSTAYTTSQSSVPLSFPELVSQFRSLLEAIAKHLQGSSGRVIIAIDELDRVGDAERARSFLAQVKAVFGIPNVYYLVSVAEDVGAAFVRRGLPHRDVTDSSLDDLLYVHPCNYAETRRILTSRAPDLTPPYTALVHALSGGVARDIIRYARRLVEVHHWSSDHELVDLAPRMIGDELADTLEAYRTLLAMKEWTDETGLCMHQLHEAVSMLRDPYQRSTPAAEYAVRTIADTPTPRRSGSGAVATAPGDALLSGDTLALWQDASACAYFFCTLLDIFATTDFDRRYSQARRQGVDGSPHRLAQARQELAVSTHSARTILIDVRSAWNLPPSAL